ncbi:hypothetical protein Asulf_00955 [Archaeoglobus sulfaticallidus PM70-1]|uniref:DUF3800 domain-containing protein n=1 Tax=Archaeoglobus sulfaticallidus PM70-1 TaxID=387631 RepID=N0BBI4_9EURY|nr:DUF3800 domain-containing protein [Archaeoglobus sulfaticallidus]AGK60959.1 hypothetical protein Asulf_00955 [Archaeoglobus sulfaticallidus PM70-1]
MGNRTYIYIDESGDLGFTEKSTKYYVIAAVETKNPQQFSRMFKKIRRKMGKKKKDIKEFKFSKTKSSTKEMILKKIAELEIQFSAVVLKKATVYQHLREKRQILHNYLTGFIVELIPFMDSRDFEIVIDKFISNEADRTNFDEYLRDHVNYECWKLGLIPPRSLNIKHESSYSCSGLQVADFVAGAIFAKYERNDDSFYRIIEPKERILKKVFR